jgi:hypothetical protein
VLSIDIVSISVYYNDGIVDPFTALQDWMRYDPKGKFLKEYDATVVYLDKDQMDENYMNYLHAKFKLSPEHVAAYKFLFQSI